MTGWEADGGADELQGGAVVTGKRTENSQHVRLGLLPWEMETELLLGLLFQPRSGRTGAEQPCQTAGDMGETPDGQMAAVAVSIMAGAERFR